MTVTLTAVSPRVFGQSIDYGALEQLFGEPVTTSATGTPLRARDVPVDMEIVTADDIRRSGAIDIPGVLSHVVGVDVQRWSNLGADVGLRGYNGPFNARLLVLINGRQVYTDDYGRTEWPALPVELAEIRQIEVVKGPNSALFGFNAAGGVINIITYNPLYDAINTASIRGGTQSYREASAVTSFSVGNDVAVRLAAGGTLTDEFGSVRNLARSQALPDSTNRAEINLDAHWRINAVSELELEATHGQDQRLAQTPVWVNTYARNASESLLARYTTDTAAGIITATAYNNWSHVEASEALYPTAVFGNQLTVAMLQDVFKPGADQTVRIGTEFRHSTINTSPVSGGDLDYTIGAVSGMWNWNVLPALSLTASGRVDSLWLQRTGDLLAGSGLNNNSWSRTNVVPSYNLGAVWHVGSMDTLRLTIARGVQLPSLLEYGAIQASYTYFALEGNPLIKTTVVDNYELNWDHDFTAIGARARAAVFYQTTHGIQSLSSPLNVSLTPAGYFLLLTDNVGDSQEVGAEFSLKGQFARDWRWELSYSPRFVHDSFIGSASPSTTGIDYEKTTPRHILNASIGWSSGPWEADSFVRFESSSAGLYAPSYTAYTLVPVGANVSFDARVAYHLGKYVTLSLAGQNILFSSARQTSFGKVEQRLLGGLSASF
jgi:iron complex outermembrane receptor protein